MTDDPLDLTRAALLDPDELERAEPALRGLLEALWRRDYARIGRVPGHGGRSALLREPLNWIRFVAGQHLLFHASAFTPLYARLVLGDRLSRLGALFFHGRVVPRDTLGADLGDERVEELLASRVLVSVGTGVASRVRITPVDGRLLVADRPEHRATGVDPVWLGGDSVRLATLLTRELAGSRFARAVDLCSGSGIQALTVRRHADHVTGVDLNPRAVAMARLNAVLHQVDEVEFRLGDLTAGLEGPFDLVVSNPPFVAMPDSARDGNLDGFGGRFGTDISLALFDALPALLADGGRAYVLTVSPTVDGRDLLADRLAGLARDAKLEVTLEPVRYTLEEPFAKHQIAVGIEFTTSYVVRITRNGSTGLRRLRMPAVKRLLHMRQVQRAHARHAS